MNVVLAAAFALLVGAGTWLVLRRDRIRVALGTALLANAAILFTMSTAVARGEAPILPLHRARETPSAAEEPPSDPVPQALALTAIVINLGSLALILGLIYRTYPERPGRGARREDEDRDDVEGLTS